jgi:[ribosomal protein S5]-alanine N-acetyltransferase
LLKGDIMKFQSERLLFREFKPEDYPYFSSVFSDEQVMKYAYMNQITDKGKMKSYFNQVIANNGMAEKRNAYEFAVFLSAEGSFIGFADIMLRYHDTKIKHGELGYFLLPEFWGNGFATEIAETLDEVCFRELKLHKVIACCNANNLQSENVMKKTGMVKEGEFRKERFKNGRWDNELRYSLLVEEWEGKTRQGRV